MFGFELSKINVLQPRSVNFPWNFFCWWLWKINVFQKHIISLYLYAYYQMRMGGCGTIKRKNISLEGVAVLWNNFFKCKAKFFQGEHQKHFADGVEGRENTKEFIFQSVKQKKFRGRFMVLRCDTFILESVKEKLFTWDSRVCVSVIHSYFQRDILRGCCGGRVTEMSQSLWHIHVFK